MRSRVYEGIYCGERSARGRRVYVLGRGAIPMLYCIGTDLDLDLYDWDEIRETYTGTDAALVDLRTYEWVREYDDLRSAVAVPYRWRGSL